MNINACMFTSMCVACVNNRESTEAFSASLQETVFSQMI